MLRSLWLTCVLALAPAIVWAQPASGPSPAAVSRTTDSATSALATAGQRVAQTTAQRANVGQRYQDQLAANDRLKKEKPSWRRDRELRSSMADSADTANQLAALDKQLATAQDELAKARRALATAIDAELAAGATGTRAQQLAQTRAQLKQAGAALKKIVLPDAEIDPLADPEELDQQAQIITETEKQLANQVTGLDAQASELAHVADLRKHNQRANDLMLLDDDQPHRNAQTSSRSATDTTQGAAVPGTGGGGDTFGGDHGGTASFETQATFVLGEVIDRSTIEDLTRASRSGDPAKRAEAAKLARDAVAARLDMLRKKRQQIEARAKQLRGKH